MTPPFRRTQRSLPIALLRAREKVMSPIRDMLSASPVSEQKWRVLRVLDEAGPLDQKRIAAEACLLLPSLTRMLQGMEAEGFVARSGDAQDRRRTIVSITPAGRDLIRQFAAPSNDILGRLEESFGRERLETLLDLLDDLQKTDL